MSEPNTAIPRGSWVLVTGITGFIGCHITRQLLERGYKVRGTVRDVAKASWLLNDVFKIYADNGEIELVMVPDFTGNDIVFDDAIKGVSAIIHLATVVTLDPDPNNVIPQTVAATTSLLKAALNEPSIKRFVYTTSYSAAAMPLEGKDIVVDRDTWNDLAVQLAWKQPYEPSNGLMVYMASKVAAEKELWNFVKENKPHFSVNAVSPSAVIGQPITRQHAVSNGAWLRLVYDGQAAVLSMIPQTYFVDVKDIALLHVASALDPDLSNVRLQAWGHRGNWNDVLAILRRLRPNRDFISDLPLTPYGDMSTDPSESLALLKKWGCQDGWKPLEETVADNISAYFEP